VDVRIVTKKEDPAASEAVRHTVMRVMVENQFTRATSRLA
jgi:hypothetical protein